MRNKKSAGISAKGYYIALVLCAVAIVIAGALYYRGKQTPEETLKTPNLDPEQQAQEVQAVATQPVAGDVVPSDAKKPEKVVKPVAGSTVADYAMETLSYNQTTRDWRVHDGIDIAAEAGATVCAAAAGEVFAVYDDETMGMTVVINHEGGYTTRYASLDTAIDVAAGDKVTAGQTIGKVGNTALLECAIGDHLHFAVSCGSATVDPAEFLGQ